MEEDGKLVRYFVERVLATVEKVATSRDYSTGIKILLSSQYAKGPHIEKYKVQ